MEILLTLSVAIWINLIYGDFNNIFNIISYIISIVFLTGSFWIVVYWFSYPTIYYSTIQTHPDKHERHCLLFLEFKREKLRAMYFYSYFAIHRFWVAFVVVWIYNFPVIQWVCLIKLNLMFFIYTFRVYKSMLQNFLHSFNWITLIAFSLCLPLFLSPSDPNKLKISGYVSHISSYYEE